MQSIIVCGLDSVLPKIARHYRALADIANKNVIICTRDLLGYSKKVGAEYGVKVIVVPKNKKEEIAQFFKLLKDVKPAHIEVYHDLQSDWSHLLRILISRYLGIPTVLVCRGAELLYWNQFKGRRKLFYKYGLRQANLILFKELHMPSRLKKLGVSKNRLHFFYNRVPYSTEEPYSAIKRQDVLFLNSWKPFRYPEIAVRVGLALSNKYPATRFLIGGARSQDEMAEVDIGLSEAIKARNLNGRIKMFPFARKPDILFKNSSIFLLPAEIVFLNYTLLEAMERGLVPVIPKVDGAEKIIDHGVDGLIVDLTEAAYASAVKSLLSDPQKREKMSQAARRKIKEQFDLKQGLKELIQQYKQKVWL